MIIIGFILNIIGIIGVIVPALPGVVLNYLALILLYLSRGQTAISIDMLIIFGLLTVSVSVLDYILPFLGAKKYGASRTGIWGAAVGMIIGLLFFPPFGIIFGLLIGAFVGELIAGKDQSQAFKAGFATFLGSLTSIVVKLLLAIAMAAYFIIHLFNI
ncbi:MAG: DUF456 domain-containing protein [Candidatus Caldatribacteriota bacterium]|nr:DUF456 domain-containing protein [Atribacterota bacterium]MDD3032007.1 DUF456 domain-containing protein [Atribacterota bacterium]MDD4288578.1 DUF456 domain-containing protein [Atribacterota bacterium]MDD4765446.1 DUF456 domain-containing protein [Atribacterota bacterium]MDD5635745.1 DUF456 domain-containing protein [Atribacterota bacterium]